MGTVDATITISLDGYVAAVDDGPGRGLGTGGEVLHEWVFGGPWRYDEEPTGEMSPEDSAWHAERMSRTGAVICGRSTYEAADHWGGRNPWDTPLFVVTNRVDEQPSGGGFQFVGSVDEALALGQAAAGDLGVNVMGGADVIRQAIASGAVEELIVVIAPVLLGGGRRLFDGFTERVELEQVGVRQSRFATFLDYRVRRG